MPDDVLDQILADATFSSQLVHTAIKAEYTARVFPDNVRDRTWVFVGPMGSVTYWDCGNGWCQVMHVNTNDPKDEHEFWQELGNLVGADLKNGKQSIKSDEVMNLLIDAGIYNPDAMLNI